MNKNERELAKTHKKTRRRYTGGEESGVTGCPGAKSESANLCGCAGKKLAERFAGGESERPVRAIVELGRRIQPEGPKERSRQVARGDRVRGRIGADPVTGT